MDKEKKEKIILAILISITVIASLPLLYDAGRALICDRVSVKGHSMEPTMYTGEHYIVWKPIIGARIYTKFKFDTDTLHCFRMPGLRKLRVGDICIFNHPYGWKEGEIGFKINYVYAKRLIGVAGDTISIHDSHYINHRVSDVGVPQIKEAMLRAIPDSVLMRGWVLPAGQFAGEGDYWTLKEFGPIMVPGKKYTVHLDSLNAQHYSKVIKYETGKESKEFIGQDYTFKKNYCFFVGDNAVDSRDSRYLGFVPEEFVIGVIKAKKRK